MDLKVYLYLMNKYQLNCIGKRTGRYIENYFFSKKEIAQALGYNGTYEPNIVEINRSLQVLKDMGLIEYSESKRRLRHQGYYHELYKVQEYSSTHVEADVNYVKEKRMIGESLSEEAKTELVNIDFRKNMDL